MRRALLALLLTLACATSALAQQFPPPGIPLEPGGRLSLCATQPVFKPSVLDASGATTDTTAETVTFVAAHELCTGSMATPSVTGGGLTAATTYWLCAVSTTAISFHTSLANAEACSSPVDLTASITVEIRVTGIQSSTIHYVCYIHCWVPLWTGATLTTGHVEWVRITSAISLDTTGFINVRDFFLRKCAAAAGVCLERSSSWTSGELGIRADAITFPSATGWSGPAVLTSDPTRLWVGTVNVISGNVATVNPGLPQVINGVVASVNRPVHIGVWNAYHRVPANLIRQEETSTWTYTTNTYRQTRASANNQLEVLAGAPRPIFIRANAHFSNGSAGVVVQSGIGKNSTTVSSATTFASQHSPSAGFTLDNRVQFDDLVFGLQSYMWLEKSVATNTTTWTGTTLSGIFAEWEY